MWCLLPLRRYILNFVNSTLYYVAETKKNSRRGEKDYFMIETPTHPMMCLICSQVVKTGKEIMQSNIFVVMHHTLKRNRKANPERSV